MIKPKNISISLRTTMGFTLAMLKPYFLKLVYPDSTNLATASVEQQKYSRAGSAVFLNRNRILGASAWTKGLPYVTYVPGGYAELAVAIIPSKKAFIQVVTLGVNGSIYSQPLPIMAAQPAYNWQVCLFAGFAVGKRWK